MTFIAFFHFIFVGFCLHEYERYGEKVRDRKFLNALIVSVDNLYAKNSTTDFDAKYEKIDDERGEQNARSLNETKNKTKPKHYCGHKSHDGGEWTNFFFLELYIFIYICCFWKERRRRSRKKNINVHLKNMAFEKWCCGCCCCL